MALPAFLLFQLLAAAVATHGSSAAQHPLIEKQAAGRSWHLNFSSAAPHHFHSIHSLLQQWPNTFFPNGHTLAPGTIPAFTKLYHGRMDAEPPPSPEWLAFDLDMSYGIMGSSWNSHMLTYQTTRPVKALYFDGESAALMGTGQLDSQMLHIYGNTSGPDSRGRFGGGLWPEYARAIGLCQWLDEAGLGRLGWGFEAVVRMNAGFEVIWCNFTSPSLRLISQLNVSAPLLGEDDDEDDHTREKELKDNQEPTNTYFPLPPVPTKTDLAAKPTNPGAQMPPNWRRNEFRQPFLRSQGWHWLTSATKHYGSSAAGAGRGEYRLSLDSCGLLSYYAPPFEALGLARASIEQKALNMTANGFWKGPSSEDMKANATAARKHGLEHLMRRRRAHTLNAVSSSEASMMRNAS